MGSIMSREPVVSSRMQRSTPQVFCAFCRRPNVTDFLDRDGCNCPEALKWRADRNSGKISFNELRQRRLNAMRTMAPEGFRFAMDATRGQPPVHRALIVHELSTPIVHAPEIVHAEPVPAVHAIETVDKVEARRAYKAQKERERRERQNRERKAKT